MVFLFNIIDNAVSNIMEVDFMSNPLVGIYGISLRKIIRNMMRSMHH